MTAPDEPPRTSQAESDHPVERRVFESIFKIPAPPEQIGAAPGDSTEKLFQAATQAEPRGADALQQLTQATDWDVAVRYHEFKAAFDDPALIRALRRVSAEAVLERARGILGAIVHPVEVHVGPLVGLPAIAERVDIDVEETLENSPLAAVEDAPPISPEDLWVSYSTHRRQPLALCVDTSLSMTGEKLALTAVALAVVLLEFAADPVGIVAFENEAKVLKEPEEHISIQDLVERFLDVPAQGYTHLEAGLREALRVAAAARGLGRGARVPTVLVTDGKYTAGKDPAFLAGRFDSLVVMKMGSERASLSLCQELARKGGGMLREVADLEDLPQAMYGVVKGLLRGAA